MFKAYLAPNAKTKDDFQLWQKLAAGGLSGMIGSSIANPTDLVKIRFQSATPTEPNPYRHTLHAFQQIYTTEGGLHGLYRVMRPAFPLSFSAAALLSLFQSHCVRDRVWVRQCFAPLF
jgi:hypothetical protein